MIINFNLSFVKRVKYGDLNEQAIVLYVTIVYFCSIIIALGLELVLVIEIINGLFFL